MHKKHAEVIGKRSGVGGHGAERAGGGEVDAEAGDLVVDDGVGKREFEDRGRSVLDAELRRVESRGRDHVAGRKEVEDGAGTVRLFAELGRLIGKREVRAVRIRIGEGQATHHSRDKENGFAQMAAVIAGIGIAGARFRGQ